MMASIVFRHASERMAEMLSVGRPDYYTREKRRTWRTLWLVKRTYRVAHWHSLVSLMLSTQDQESDESGA
jgi:hypothetical protein